ncbi:MAG: hypothetical protein IKH84_05370 [Ottowia sp.]|nr:hypothetical protein [Ottowia sp.]
MLQIKLFALIVFLDAVLFAFGVRHQMLATIHVISAVLISVAAWSVGWYKSGFALPRSFVPSEESLEEMVEGGKWFLFWVGNIFFSVVVEKLGSV